ncbi:MAG: DUF4157 domain-containing protein, partial [Terriglobia bacterium]
MLLTKTQAEPQTKASPDMSTAKESALSEKKIGPQVVTRSRAATALPPPNGTPPPARAGAILTSPDSGYGTTGRARMSKAMQQGLGNERINRMIQRKCACGGQAGPDGECAECKAKRMALQRQAAGPDTTPELPESVHGVLNSSGGQPLDKATRGTMEEKFDTDFGGVRVHTNEPSSHAANDISATAFTHGQNIYFSAGQYQPGTPSGDKLLAHELTHTIQQKKNGNVHASRVNNMSISQPGDPDEQEAEQAAQKFADTTSAKPMALKRAVIQRNDAPNNSIESSGEEEASVTDEAESSAVTSHSRIARNPIQSGTMQGTIYRQTKKKTTHVPYQIHVNHPMTGDEFKAAAMQQVFGGPVDNISWQNIKPSYDPSSSPVTLNVDIVLLKHQRGEASRKRGIGVDASGDVTGAKERAKTFHTGPRSDEKTALMEEIDRRYFEAIGDKTETKIKAGEKAKSELWKSIRDEVLFQSEYIANLPPNVKLLIKQSITGKVLTPSDYDQLFRIAKKIEAMPPGQVTDYASKVTGTTTNLNQFEASLESYSTEMAKRQKGTE